MPVYARRMHENARQTAWEYNLYPSTKTLENGAYFESRVVVAKMETTTEENSAVENKKSPAGVGSTDRTKNKKGYKNKN